MEMIKGYLFVNALEGKPVETDKGYVSDTGFLVHENLNKISLNFFRASIEDMETLIYEVMSVGDILSRYTDSFLTTAIVVLKELSLEELLNLANEGERNLNFYNIGNMNNGARNKGNSNLGDKNVGDYNTGNLNLGVENGGNANIGRYNFGNDNKGAFNSGNFNIGDGNHGSHNFGDGNLGDFNRCDFSAGCFCTSAPTMTFFNKPSDMSLKAWLDSKARNILMSMPKAGTTWIEEGKMTEKEKENFPEYKITGGYLKKYFSLAEDRQTWWDSLTKEEKETVKNIPNFDAMTFCKCTGIKVE